MKDFKVSREFGKRRRQSGVTLIEVVIGMAISALLIGCMATGYTFANRTADRAQISLAANAQAVQRLEQTRAAKWDTVASPAIDELVSTNFPPQIVLLDIPQTGNNLHYGTNFTTIITVSTNPPLKMISVDCVWTHANGPLQTNSLVTYRSPDQ